MKGTLTVVSPGKWDGPDWHDADRGGAWEGSTDRQAGGPHVRLGHEALAVLQVYPFGPTSIFEPVINRRLSVQPGPNPTLLLRGAK